jgi:hypothetical protein
MTGTLELPLGEKDELEKQTQQVEGASLEQRIRDAQPITDQSSSVQFVDLERINPNEIQSPADFKSPAEYAEQLREAHMLKQMLPALEQGVDPELFDQWDQANQIGHYSPERYVRGYTDVYHAYYGAERIGLERRPDGTYDVLNGRHRIFAARQAGLEKIPAQVLG